MDTAWNIEAVLLPEGETSSPNTGILERNWSWCKGSATCDAGTLSSAYSNPEFMGNTGKEEKDPVYRVVVKISHGVKESTDVCRFAINCRRQWNVGEAENHPADKVPYFELVKYPVQAATQMNRKLHMPN